MSIQQRRKLRIGVTIGIRKEQQSLWENGIGQNCIYLARLLQASSVTESVYLINASGLEAPNESMMLGHAGVRIMPLSEASDLDVMIEMGAQLPDDWAANFRKRGGKYTAMRVGNDYAIDIERAIYEKPSASLCTGKLFDVVWTIPGHEKMCADYFSITTRSPVRIVPHIWSPLFFQKKIDELPLGHIYGYRPGRERWRVCTFEPNINTVKTSMIPMLVCEEAYRKEPRFLEYYRLCNTFHMKENPFLIKYANSLDIVTHGLATFEGRFGIYDYMAREGDVILSHQWGCPQNYLYYEALYGQYPLVHNSELLRDAGYYYPDCDSEKGAEVLLDAFHNHDANIDEYAKRAAAALLRVDADNPENIEIYTQELLRLYEVESAEELHLPDSDPAFPALALVTKEKKPHTALICVTRNNFKLLDVTLDSILRNTKPGTYDLYIIDNASTDETTSLYGKSLGDHVTVIRNNRNLNWVKAINQGLDLTHHYRHIGLLNNDIEVSEGWLENMVGILDGNAAVGAVGPVSSNPRDWQCYDRVRDFFPDMSLPELKEISRTDVPGMASKLRGNPQSRLVGGMLAFFCTILRRSMIDEIGYLDEDFNDLFLGDDDEYCHRLQKAGYKLALATSTYVAHHSGSSSLNIPEFEKRQQKALELLTSKRC
jgi:GT2 family glycosyltransferase